MEKKRKKPKLSAAEKKRRSENMAKITAKRVENQKQKKAEEEVALGAEMPITHKDFGDLYVWGGKGFRGNPTSCYNKIFDVATNAEAGRCGRALLLKPHMRTYIDKQMEEYRILMRGEEMRNLDTLVEIRDEMANAEYINRFNEVNGVPACRNVAIKATETINKMLGLEKPKEIKVTGEGQGGLVFNLIAPEATKDE